MEYLRLVSCVIAILGLTLMAGCTGEADGLPVHDPDPRLELALDRLFFGEGGEQAVTVGTTAERSIQFFNAGEAELRIYEVTLSGPGASLFELGQLERTTIALNEVAQLKVQFKPTAAGRFVATVTIRSNAHNLPEATVALQGRAE
ncbi:MAG: choice-of-anchor D domain-containing protein [Myxococcaceae bacterium]|nr:choice-of-anchor D domain-containing protein [Myxococcaceae bacterium]